MLLCDVGNTSYHFFDTKSSYKKSVSTFEPESIQEEVYFISVNSAVTAQLADLENWIDLSVYIDKSKYYETMGIDRVFAVEAVENGVVVDAGSAITVDIVKNNNFLGGFIYPGVKAMKKCYKDISPALDYAFNFSLDTNNLPKNSQDAISYGYLKILQSEVLSHKLPIILTGGDAETLSPLFQNVRVDEMLIFQGMQKIIEKLG